MAAEWAEAGGADGQAILDAFKARVGHPTDRIRGRRGDKRLGAAPLITAPCPRPGQRCCQRLIRKSLHDCGLSRLGHGGGRLHGGDPDRHHRGVRWSPAGWASSSRATNYAGYCMASASFFALAYALNHGAHIRVSLLLGRLGRWRRWGEIWCLCGVAAVAATFFARYAIKANWSVPQARRCQPGPGCLTPIWDAAALHVHRHRAGLAVALWDHGSSGIGLHLVGGIAALPSRRDGGA